ncbi:MAG TPA: hypothetical protein VGM57_11070 [Pseudolabrys sp.]|jgi:hypothetical protein
MSRKFILGLAAVATLATAALASGAADAAHSQRGNGYVNVHPPVHRLPPRIVRGPHFHHDHVVVGRIYERGYVRPVGLVQSVSENPCTCLWKGYTPEGAVVFKDLCTKEMASAPVDGAPAQTGEIQAPNNFAGKTYQDYLAANPQAQSAEKKN